MKVLLSLVMIGRFAAFLFHFSFNKIGNGPYLGLVIGFADNKKIGNGLWYFPEVKRNDLITFLFLYGPDDGFKDF